MTLLPTFLPVWLAPADEALSRRALPPPPTPAAITWLPATQRPTAAVALAATPFHATASRASDVPAAQGELAPAVPLALPQALLSPQQAAADEGLTHVWDYLRTQVGPEGGWERMMCWVGVGGEVWIPHVRGCNVTLPAAHHNTHVSSACLHAVAVPPHTFPHT